MSSNLIYLYLTMKMVRKETATNPFLYFVFSFAAGRVTKDFFSAAFSKDLTLFRVQDRTVCLRVRKIKEKEAFMHAKHYLLLQIYRAH